MTTAAIAQFIRHIPLSTLKTCLDYHMPFLAANLHWPDEANQLHALFRMFFKSDTSKREDMHLLAERINKMADDEGQTALACSVKDKKQFNKLQNAHERSAWVLATEPAAFRHAEEIRYADLNRRGQMWDSFVGARGCSVSDDPNKMKRLRSHLHRIFPDSPNIKVEIYKRKRVENNKSIAQIYQVSIYIEELAESYLELENDKIITKTRRPLQEIVICYEPQSGLIEIVAPCKEQREKLAAAFSAVFLDHYIAEGAVSLNAYDLSSLFAQRAFPTDIEDGIENVSVLSIKLRSINGDGNIILEIPNKHNRSIYEQAHEWFEENSPFLGGFIVQSAKIAIQFYPEAGQQRAKVLPIKIALPNRCDLHSRTEAKCLLGEKYLERWGLRGEI
jgi:hypothetical protein